MPSPPRPAPSRRLSPPHQLDLALATFLLKILDPRFLRPRPPRPGQSPQEQESRRLPRTHARRAQRDTGHPANRTSLPPTSLKYLKARPLGAEAAGRAGAGNDVHVQVLSDQLLEFGTVNQRDPVSVGELLACPAEPRRRHQYTCSGVVVSHHPGQGMYRLQADNTGPAFRLDQ